MTLSQVKLWRDPIIRAHCPSTGGWRVGGMSMFCIEFNLFKQYMTNMVWIIIRANWDGELGVGHVGFIGDTPDEMGDYLEDVDLGSNFTAIQVVPGEYHTCALSNSSKVKCWGYVSISLSFCVCGLFAMIKLMCESV